MGNGKVGLLAKLAVWSKNPKLLEAVVKLAATEITPEPPESDDMNSHWSLSLSHPAFIMRRVVEEGAIRV